MYTCKSAVTLKLVQGQVVKFHYMHMSLHFVSETDNSYCLYHLSVLGLTVTEVPPVALSLPPNDINH